MAVGVSDHAEEGQADAEELGQVFRNEAVPLIDEDRFAEMYSCGHGQTEPPVQTVLGVLVLKEMFDLTDIEAPGGVGVQPAVASRASWVRRWRRHTLRKRRCTTSACG